MIKLSFCFQLIPFLESSLLSVHNKYKPLKKNDHVCQSFAPTMQKVGSRYNEFGFEKKNAFGFEKKKNCWVRIPGFHLSDKKKMYLSTKDYGGGVVGGTMVSMCLPFWKPVRLDWNWGTIHECSRTYRNNAILSFDFIIFVSPSSLLWHAFDFYPFNTNDHRYPYLNSIYKWEYLVSI